MSDRTDRRSTRVAITSTGISTSTSTSTGIDVNRRVRHAVDFPRQRIDKLSAKFQLTLAGFLNELVY